MAGDDDSRLHQLLVERGPRTRRWTLRCFAVSILGLVVLVVSGLTGTGSPWDVIGVLLFVPFGAMAFNGAVNLRRRRRAT